MNMSINQQPLDAFVTKVGKSNDFGQKKAIGGFGKALAYALKDAAKSNSQQKAPKSKMEAAQEKVNLQTCIPTVKPDSFTNAQTQSVEKNTSELATEVTGEVQGHNPQDDSESADGKDLKQVVNEEQQPWWVELMSLLNLLAQLGGLETTSLPASMDYESSLTAPAELVTQEVSVLESPGESKLVMNGKYSSQQLASISDFTELVSNLVTTAGLNQPEEQANQRELQKLSAMLKPVIEQLLQGKVTVAAAAEGILNDHGMMEQIALQVKLLKLQQLNHYQSLEDGALVEHLPTVIETNIPGSRNESVSQGASTSTGQLESPKTADDAKSSNNPVNLAGKLDQEAKAQFKQETKVQQTLKTENSAESITNTESKTIQESKTNTESKENPESKTILAGKTYTDAKTNTDTKTNSEGKIAQAGSNKLQELSPVLSMPGTGANFNELPEQLWSIQPFLQNETNEPPGAVKTQITNTAKELVNQMVFKQLVDSSHLLVGKDHSEIKIQLKPEFLGKVSLEISIEHGVVKAEIAAENQQVKQLIEANLGNLKQTLTSQGLKVDQLVVNLGHGQAQNGQSRGQNQNSGRSPRRGQLSEQIFEVGEINEEYGSHLQGANRVVDYKV